jgi:hypothetical protein
MAYVDKTASILDLVQRGDRYLFVRPRGFGKSLLCDTIKCLFEGKKELFEGRHICDKWDWEAKYPVISIVFGDESIDTPEALEQSLNDSLGENCETNGINVNELGESLPALRFRDLIIYPIGIGFPVFPVTHSDIFHFFLRSLIADKLPKEEK